MTVTINYLSDLTGFDRRTIQKRLSSLPKSPDNTYDSPTALKMIYCPDGLDPTQERAALDRARRELVELQKAERIKDLIPADVVKQQWERLAGNTRAKLLNLPGRLASTLGGRDMDPATVERESRRLVYESLAELAAGGEHGNH